MKGLWTKVLTGLLVLFGIGGAFALTMGIPPGTVLMSMVIYLTFAAIVWMETEQSARLALVLGIVLFATELASAAGNWYPEYGDPAGQFGYAVFTVIIPVLAFLCYRDVMRRQGTAPAAAPAAG